GESVAGLYALRPPLPTSQMLPSGGWAVRRTGKTRGADGRSADVGGHQGGQVWSVRQATAAQATETCLMDHAARQLQPRPFDVVALVGSAGSYGAICTILEHLPARFPLGLVIVQHLGPQSTRTVAHLDAWLPFPVRWAEDGAPVAPGQVLVCPPRTFLELLP